VLALLRARSLCYDYRVHRRFMTFVSVAAILLMFAPQLCEVFDRWDSISDFGNDTEFMLIVTGICIGLCLLSALLIVHLVRLTVSVVMRLLPTMARAAQPHSYGNDFLQLLFSPPLSLTSLRI
jgi:hypothetical protein